jgi:hypothetical protein
MSEDQKRQKYVIHSDISGIAAGLAFAIAHEIIAVLKVVLLDITKLKANSFEFEILAIVLLVGLTIAIWHYLYGLQAKREEAANA